MIIDQTRYDAFWRNPDKYRLTYQLNLIPKATPYGLQRGTAFHTIEEEVKAGRQREEVDAILRGETPNARGDLVDKLDPKAIAVAWALFEENQRNYGHLETVAAELEFVVPIEGSPHCIAGRLDEVILRNGQQWVGEMKTANYKANYSYTMRDWQTKAQADFVLIGAKALGYKPEGVFVRTLVEKTPPVIWEFEIKRSDFRLKAMQLYVHQTCEMIGMLLETFGKDKPWPHISYQWPCCEGPEKCDYAFICGTPTELIEPSYLTPFKERKEHLACLRSSSSEQ